MKILAIDDNQENLSLIRDVLSMTDYEVFVAENGFKGLELAEAEKPHLILLDVNMPGMSGFEVCQKLKANPQTMHISVIMLTALTDVDSRVQGLAAGADDYLTKPFSPRELIARVNRSLRSKTSADDLRQKEARVRRAFESFVAAPIVERILETGEMQLGGKLQQVTVLFADLEGFTSLSERVNPQDLLQMLNAYHKFMVDIIMTYGGTIDKFVGDGLMALYNTPAEQEDHVGRAVKTALHIQDELHWFHQKQLEDFRLKVNFGIHSGIAVVGMVGTDKLMNFTAVGDTVNVAARLQGIAKGGQILVTASVFEHIQDFVFGRSRGSMHVKGRREPVATYEISNTFFS